MKGNALTVPKSTVIRQKECPILWTGSKWICDDYSKHLTRLFDTHRDLTAKHAREDIHQIQLNSNYMVDGNLKRNTLIDSGALKILISTSTSNNSPYIKIFERAPCVNIKFMTTGEWHCIPAVYALIFKINIQGNIISITALSMENVGGLITIILGIKSIKDVGGVLDFSENMLTFKHSSALFL